MNNTPLKIAVFDIDRTLLLKTSAEVQLIRFLRERKILPVGNLLRNALSFLRQVPNGFEKVATRKSSYLRGLDAKHVISFLPELFEIRLSPRFSTKIQDYMHMLRDKGYEIILISGTLDFILKFLIDHFGAQGGLGSHAEIKEGRFTGRILGIHPYLHGKVKALEKVLAGRKVDFACSYGFGDSWADVPLLSLFGNPIAVNPGQLLHRKAKKLGWTIIRDSIRYEVP